MDATSSPTPSAVSTPEPLRYPGLGAHSPLRIIRGVADLAASEEFWVGGLGLDVLARSEDPATLTLGWRSANWVLHLVADPTPRSGDTLLLATGAPVEEHVIERLCAAGGVHLATSEAGEATFSDPDGNLLTLSPGL